MGWPAGTPEPSRRPSAAGQVHRRSAGRRSPRRSRTGPGDQQRVLALEEAVAPDPAGGAALARVLGEGRDLDRAGVGAGQGLRRTGDGDDLGRGPGLSGRHRPRRTPRSPRAPSLIPAMPPPERPCGRTEAAGKCSSWASLVMKVSSWDSLVSSTAPTTVSPGLEPDHLPGVAAQHLRVDPFDHAAGRAEGQPQRGLGQGGQAQHPLAALQGDQLGHVGAALQVGRAGRRRHRRQVEGVDLDQPARRGDHPEIAPRGAQHGGDDHVVVGALPARRAADRRGWSGPADRPRTAAPSTGRRRSPAVRRRWSPPRRWRPAGWCGAGCRAAWRSRPARSRPGCGAARGSRGSRSARRWWPATRPARSPARCVEYLVSRRSGISRM